MIRQPATASPRRVLDVEHSPLDFGMPAGACDCHVHVFGPYERFPLSPHRVYMPGPAPIEDLIAHQNALGLERVVIVQPSIYGTDNSCMLHALRRLGSQARGIAVVDSGMPEPTLRELHEAGVRGLRVNLETAGVADPEAIAQHIEASAAQAAPFGWHLQVYTDLDIIATLHDRIQALPVPVVFDHFAKARAEKGQHQTGLPALLSLMRSGKAYVKLSAPRRISARPDHADAGEIARTLLKANPERLLWGSDWPHPGAWPGIPRDPNRIEPLHPDDDGLALNRLNTWMGDAALMRQILVDNPARLYGF
ncbi:amidohydrolase family protein [Microvirga sp. ACRRW]|uniref:amidohydrolase family protein n=1 Tax=Microvirga sp. ACRRW TaxID=2918205 RepID=UPI001EF3FF9E|nr:amidohydrolase family protein [Microvirga sp. ACRRW]MCG7391609.1 amidohydrolase family protein [Microvirga sp. ACRRW]